MIPDFKNIEKRFHHYVDGFVHRHRPNRHLIELKREHSVRVEREARCLAAAESFSPSETLLLRVAALLHDIGRFPQFERFGTFNDRDSVDHGRLGHAVLADDLLSGFSPDQRRRIRLSVFLHNRKSLPLSLDSDILILTQAVRDADKLDIFPVLLEHFEPDGKADPVVTLGLISHPDRYSSAIVNQVRQRALARYEDMVWVNDFKLLLASWVYDLNFFWTRQALYDRGLLDRLLRLMPQSHEIQEVAAQIRDDLMPITSG